MQDPQELLRVTLASVHDGVIAIDAAGQIFLLNAAAATMTGFSEAESLGKPIDAVLVLRETGSDAPLSNAVLSFPARAELPAAPFQALLLDKDGRRTAVEVSSIPLKDTGSNSPGRLIVLHDIGEMVQLAERRSYLAQYDPLTGLPNRILLIDRMEQATKVADRNSRQMAVLSIDLDRFAELNAVYGKAIADKLLKEAAYRISGALRESDTVCRLGADDFVVLLPGVKSIADVQSLAAKLLEAIAQPFDLDGSSIQTSCSIGISLYPQDAYDAGTLMRLSDRALSQAKQDGRNCYRFAREPESVIVNRDDAAQDITAD